MATLKYLSQYFSTTLNVGGGIDDSQTTGIILQSVSGVTDITKPGQICITYSDPIDTSVAEWIDYTSINGSNELVGAVRGREGYSAHIHLQNATVAFVMSASHHNDVVDLLNGTEAGIKVKTAIYDENGNEVIKTPATTSAVNEVTVTNSATGNAVQVSATGGDTNIDLKLVPKGTGALLDKNGEALSPNHSMARQAIINGNFDVWQRGTTSAIADATTLYLGDRWFDYHADDGGTLPTLTRSRQAITAGALFNSFYTSRLAMNGTGTSLGVNSLAYLAQRIENGTRNLCGDGKKVTLSFYAKSDIAGKKLGYCLFQGYGTGGSPTAQETITGATITLTSSWVKYTVTFTTNTLASKTFGTANDDVLTPSFFYMWGDTIGDAFGFTGIETYGSGFVDIAQVQLCAGDVALPFQPKSFAQELLDCMRYYEKSYLYAVVPGTDTSVGTIQTHGRTTTWFNMTYLQYKVQKRTTTTPTFYSQTGASGKIRNVNAAADIDAGTQDPSESGSNFYGGSAAVIATNEYHFHYTASAEL